MYQMDKRNEKSSTITPKKASGQSEKKNNTTGIPTQMKMKFEGMTGLSFDDVKVHYNSSKPAQMKALAYTKGNEVHVGPGQEKYLGHELGHVVQQKQGRVKATESVAGELVNSDVKLEQEADRMGDAAVQMKQDNKHNRNNEIIQYIKLDPKSLRILSSKGDTNGFERTGKKELYNIGEMSYTVDGNEVEGKAYNSNPTLHHILPCELLSGLWGRLLTDNPVQWEQIMIALVRKQQEISRRIPLGVTNTFSTYHVNHDMFINGEYKVSAEEFLEDIQKFKEMAISINQIMNGTEDEQTKESKVDEQWKKYNLKPNLGNQSVDLMVELFQWMPGNLVMGPTESLRTLDNGNEFDKEAAGFHDDDKEYYEVLYNDVNGYVNPDEKSVKQGLMENAKLLEKILLKISNNYDELSKRVNELYSKYKNREIDIDTLKEKIKEKKQSERSTFSKSSHGRKSEKNSMRRIEKSENTVEDMEEELKKAKDDYNKDKSEYEVRNAELVKLKNEKQKIEKELANITFETNVEQGKIDTRNMIERMIHLLANGDVIEGKESNWVKVDKDKVPLSQLEPEIEWQQNTKKLKSDVKRQGFKYFSENTPLKP